MYPNKACDWTPVALSADLPLGTVVPGVADGVEIALWRGQSGTVSACLDRCPHRGMRLSHGFVRGEVLSCIYHGWGYGTDGGCVRIPAHPDLVPPSTINTNPRSVVEKDGIVWVGGQDSGASLPGFDGLEPLRSLVIAAGSEEVCGYPELERQENGLFAFGNGEVAFFFLPAAARENETCVHVLLEDSASFSERIAVSRAAESLRRKIEAHARELSQ